MKFILFCFLLVTVNSQSLFSGHGFQVTPGQSRRFIHHETAQNNEDLSIIGNNSDVIDFLKWKIKFLLKLW